MHFNYLKFCKVTNAIQQEEEREHHRHFSKDELITQGKNAPNPPNSHKIEITKKYKKKKLVLKVTIIMLLKSILDHCLQASTRQPKRALANLKCFLNKYVCSKILDFSLQ